MEESMLEWYFDNFIANDFSKMMEEEESEKPSDEMDLSFRQDASSQDDSAETRRTDSNSISLDFSSQNSTAADKLPSERPPSGPDASVIHPSTPEIPVRPELIIQIQNVVSTVKLGCHLDLVFIARRVWNVKYNPKSYKAAVMRIRKPRTTAMIYKSGSIVCTGAKSEEQSRLAARKFARIVQKLGFPARFLDFRIQNLVASCKIFPVSLEQLVLAHHQHCSYEPELFPGLFYDVMPGITVTIFASGKISLSGAKKQAEIYKAFDIVYPILSDFRRK